MPLNTPKMEIKYLWSINYSTIYKFVFQFSATEISLQTKKIKKYFETVFSIKVSTEEYNLPTGGLSLSRYCLSSRLYAVEITLAPLCCAN